jgi:LPS-assembly protein
MKRRRLQDLRWALPLSAMLPVVVADPLGAQAQGIARSRTPAAPVSRTEPVTFTADSVTYDNDSGIVTATGHVEAWQNDHILRADKVTFNRNTNVAAASGHVVLMEPDGQVVFSDYAELDQGMRDGVMRAMRAQLAENGKLAANGARRTGGAINELSRAVYSTCNLCAKDPTKAPLWQLRASSAVQDTEAKRIEYEDAVLDIYGIPVLYLPYFWNADPSAKRESGFLVPNFGNSSYLGPFLRVPYYLVINEQSDITFEPEIAAKSGPQLSYDYRQRFNDGTMTIDGSVAYDQDHPQGHVFATGNFSYNDTWRYGFNVNEASSANYLRDFAVPNNPGSNVLSSQVFAEGFGQGAYARVDLRGYQGLNNAVSDERLPFVLPHYQYSYVGQPDNWGGRVSVDAGAFNILRSKGANDERINLSANWERPWIGRYGEVYKATLHVDSEAYNGYNLDQAPAFATVDQSTTVRALPTAAMEVRWPWARAGAGGGQIIEPIAQIIVAPNTGSSSYAKTPNEDSLTADFTDENLFVLNRFPGIDRLEGGMRANLGLHTAWNFPSGLVDTLIGQSYRDHPDDTFGPIYGPNTGLNQRVSDVVARITYSPSSFFDITGRTRVDHQHFDVHEAEAISSMGVPELRLTGGYIYTSYNPYYSLDNPPEVNPNSPRNEVTMGLNSRFGPFKLSATARRNLQTSAMDTVGADASYEDECSVFEVKLYKRYTSLNGDRGDTTVLFQITLKTVGTFGFHGS